MDRLHSMRVFARVIDAGSFSAAARELALSPAVVTRLVADLEEHLGARLINRTTRRLALTDAGERYLGRVRQIMAEVDEAEAQVGAASTQPRGHLRVLVAPAFAAHQLAQHLPGFRTLYPQVTLELVVSGLAEAVDERFDLSILGTGAKPPQGDFVVHPLLSCEDVVCASPAYLAQRGRPVHPQELAQHERLLAGAGGELAFQYGTAGSAAALTLVLPRPALATVHVDTLYAAALAGMGVAVLPSLVAEPALADGRLERLLCEWRLAGSTVSALVPTRKHLPARTAAFVEFLVRAYAAGAG